MSLKTVKNQAVRLGINLAAEISKREEKIKQRSERWQRSQHGKEYKLDLRLLRNLYDSIYEFNASIEHEDEEE